jgi:two-component system sensor kinase FixL
MANETTLMRHPARAKNIPVNARGDGARNVPIRNRMADGVTSAAEPAQRQAETMAKVQPRMAPARREVVEAVERERNRIGRDLHDGIQGTLVGVHLMLGAIKQRLAGDRIDGECVAREIDGLARIVQDTIGQMRGIAMGLCPVDLKVDGLAKAFNLLADTTSSLFGIPCHFVCEKPVYIEDAVVATQLYYIGHEAVNNARKHAKAGNISIRMEGERDWVTLTVEDDGVGLPEGRPPLNGMGLRAMHYRAKLIGATIRIRSKARRGTAVECFLSAAGAAAERGDRKSVV